MRGGSIIELIDRNEALDLDGELVALARSQTAVRLAIGDGFVALGKGWQELGFSTFAGYVRERCLRSGRWGEETRTLATRLAQLPRIRERLLSGAIGWCMAELLARDASADDEEELLEATRGMTVREVRRALRERGDARAAADEQVRFGTLDVSVTLEEAWALEATRPMVELLDGRGEPGAWLESVLAEAQCALSNVAPGVELAPEDVAARHAAWVASIAAGEERLDRREARAEPALPPMPEVAEAKVVDEMPSTPLGIDRMLVRELAPRLASCDVRFGALLSRFFRARGWRVLGFASEKQSGPAPDPLLHSSADASLVAALRLVGIEPLFLLGAPCDQGASALSVRRSRSCAGPAHERLGMSRSAVHARIALARRVLHLHEIGDALADGRIGYEAATLIARVATPDTQAQWIERARRRTFKHLREEVSAAELIARMMRLDDLPAPPSVEEIAIVQALERDMKCGAYARRAFGIEREDDAPARVDAAMERAPSSTYAEMAKSALAVQKALRAVIATTRAVSLSAEEAESACTGFVGPEGELPVIDLEDDVVWSLPAYASGASDDIVQMSAGEPSADTPTEEDGLVQMSADASNADALGAENGVVQMSAQARRWGKVTRRFRAREDTILHYRLLQAAYERAGMGVSFVQFMVLAFWSSWAEVLGRTNACESILRRDGYECTCPVCTRESAPGSHHVRFRSHGGGDEDENRTSPCGFCHLDGVHGGRLKVTGEAPGLLWLIGRTPIMEVRGRERRTLV